jgi:para-aminobenzoate synthetase component 1
VIIPVQDLPLFKQKVLQWASSFDAVCYLDSNGFNDPYSKFDTLIAIGAKDEVTAQVGSAFDQLETFRQDNPGWVTGFFGYDLKNETERLSSANPDGLQFPDLYFFSPLHLIIIKDGKTEIISDEPEQVFDLIDQQELIIYSAQSAIT